MSAAIAEAIHADAAVTAEARDDSSTLPVGHRGGPPLYGRMMKAIRAGHSFGNYVRMLKLPLVFLEPHLYAGAITQFYWLSSTLEAQLAKHHDHPMIQRIAALKLCVTPGYESDLKQLFGEEWHAIAAREKTAATVAYMETLERADAVALTAAAFILYGALVVGGGKMTQRKVRKVIPTCEHKLFDVHDDMKVARQSFKNTFTAIGKEFPEHFAALEADAARFMALNNTVVISVRCWGTRATKIACLVTAVGAATAAVIRTWWRP
jgi:hypothetical protein